MQERLAKEKNFKVALHDLQKKEDCLRSMADELTQCESLTGQQLIEDIYNNTADVKQTIRDVKHQLEMKQEENISGVKNPAAEPPGAKDQTKRFWGHCAKGLLVGVFAGICTVGILAYVS